MHSDIGGGYPEVDKNRGLWRISFKWMVEEARKSGLLIDEQRLQNILSHTVPSEFPWQDEQHESLTPGWWPAEFFPKLEFNPQTKRRRPKLGLGRTRTLMDGVMLHESALRRIRERNGYAPRNMSKAFLEHVRALEQVPESLEYFAKPNGTGNQLAKHAR